MTKRLPLQATIRFFFIGFAILSCALAVGQGGKKKQSAPHLSQNRYYVTIGNCVYTPAREQLSKRISQGQTHNLGPGDRIHVMKGSMIWVRLLGATVAVRGPGDFYVPALPTKADLRAAHIFLANTRIGGRTRGQVVAISCPRWLGHIDPLRFVIVWTSKKTGSTIDLTLSLPYHSPSVELDDISATEHRIMYPILKQWLVAECLAGYSGPFIGEIHLQSGDLGKVVFFCKTAHRRSAQSDMSKLDGHEHRLERAKAAPRNPIDTTSTETQGARSFRFPVGSEYG